jgi:hypothetical protein
LPITTTTIITTTTTKTERAQQRLTLIITTRPKEQKQPQQQTDQYEILRRTEQEPSVDSQLDINRPMAYLLVDGRWSIVHPWLIGGWTTVLSDLRQLPK